jgi:hypothetical protein
VRGLACQLVGHAQTLYHAEAPSEAGILKSIHAGLRNPESGLSGPEAGWVVTRLAELLEWASPELPPAQAEAAQPPVTGGKRPPRPRA